MREKARESGEIGWMERGGTLRRWRNTEHEREGKRKTTRQNTRAPPRKKNMWRMVKTTQKVDGQKDEE